MALFELGRRALRREEVEACDLLVAQGDWRRRRHVLDRTLLPLWVRREGDVTKAFEWWERASGCGHAEATRQLALSYEYGLGVEKNKAKALELYLKAAELGEQGAAYQLGVIYHCGRCGVAVNKTEALKWYRVAVELGDTYAQGVDRTRGRARGGVSERSRPYAEPTRAVKKWTRRDETGGIFFGDGRTSSRDTLQ